LIKKTLQSLLRDKRAMVVGGSLTVVVIAAAGYAAAQWGLRGFARDRVVEVLRLRLGVESEVEGVSLGVSGLTLTGVRTRSSADEWLSFDASRVVVRFRVPALLLGGSGMVKSITVEGLEGSLRVTDDMQSRASVLLPGDGPGSSEEGVKKQRAIALNDVSIRVLDEYGELIDLRGSLAAEEGMGGSADLKRVRVGSEPGSVVVLEGVGLSVRSENGKYKIDKINVDGMRFELAERSTEPEVDPAGSADEGLAQEGAQASPSPDPGTAAVGVEPDTRGEAAGTLERIRGAIAALLRATRKSAGPRPAGSGVEGSEGHPLPSALGKRLSLTLKQATVFERSEGEMRALMEGLSGRMTGEGEGEFHLRGRGRARQGGKMSWGFRLWPDQLRAEGSIEAVSLPLALVEPLLPEIPWCRPERGRVDAELVLGAESVSSVAVRGKVELSRAAIFSPRVAPEPIDDIEVLVEGRGHWLPVGRRLEIEEAKVSMGKAQVAVRGAVELTPDYYLFDVDLELPPTPCTEAVSSIPEDLLDELQGFQWTGSLAGRLKARVDSRELENTDLAIDVADGCEFKKVPGLADLRRFRMPFLHYVTEPDGEVLEMEMGPGSASWTYLEEVSPFMVYAVIAHEDAAFFQHKGFSPAHIRNALIRNLKEKRYVIGASTITMQLVKNLFLRREKTLARKVQEVLLTWWVERVMEKRDILELYLNVIEYGPGVYGIRHAARHYFNRLPSELSPAESVYLSMILPNPRRYHVHFESGEIPASWVERMRRILLRMAENEWYSPEAVAYGLREIERFHFARAGEVPESRQIPGGAARLPYVQEYDDEWEWDPDAVPASGGQPGGETPSQRDTAPAGAAEGSVQGPEREEATEGQGPAKEARAPL
jgi:hypothetical protein